MTQVADEENYLQIWMMVTHIINEQLWTTNKDQSFSYQAGFRDGAAAGRDAVFQKGFDMGYAEGYQAASSLGYLKGVISAVLHYNQVDSESAAISLKTALEKTSVGMCQLCQTEPTNLQENKELSTTKPLSDIVANQRDYVNNAIKRIKQDNFQLLQEWSKK